MVHLEVIRETCSDNACTWNKASTRGMTSVPGSRTFLKDFLVIRKMFKEYVLGTTGIMMYLAAIKTSTTP